MDQLLISALSELDENGVLKIVRKMVLQGKEPLYIQKQLNRGIIKVKEMYDQGEYFIADLIMARMIFKEALKIEEMQDLKSKKLSKPIGKVILGTAYGDLHDIGKDIFASILETAGFIVYDLGIDVAKDVFIEKIKEIEPDIVSISGTLTLTIENMKEIVEKINQEGLRNKVKIIVGGNPINESACIYIGADDFSKDVSEGLNKCLNWINIDNTVRSF